MTRARDIASNGGLVLISSTTIGSAVSSIVVSSAFSATYDNYRIIVSGGTASTGSFARLKLGSTTTGYYSSLIYAVYDSSTFVGNANNNNGANFSYAGYGNTNGIMFNIELLSPNLAKNTFFASRYVESNASGSVATGTGNGFINDTTQYTDFTLTPNSGTYTGGTIRVYGYKNS